MTKRFGTLAVTGRVRKVLDGMHWAGIVCDHGKDGGDTLWLASVFADPHDQDAAAYAVTFGKAHRIPQAQLQILGTPPPHLALPTIQNDMPIIEAPVTLLEDLTCPACRITPEVSVDEVIDVVALWTKTVFGPTIQLRHLETLADRWCGEDQ